MSWYPRIPTGVRARRLAAAGAVVALLFAWVALPGLGGDRIVGAVTRGTGEPLPVASAFVAGTSTGTGSDTAAVATATNGAGDMPAADPTGAGASSSALASSSAPPTTVPASVTPPASQPVAAGIARQGPGTYQLAPGGTAIAGTGGTLVTYSVEVESGLPFDPAAVAARVDQVLGDSRSWIGIGRWQLQRVEVGADARIVVATPGTTDSLCYPLQTAGTYSCRNGPFVVLNADRWASGADSWGADVDGYRGYLVNHEFGHFLGFSHTPCPAAGSPAPVMLQQTKGLGGCVPNAWPTVTGG